MGNNVLVRPASETDTATSIFSVGGPYVVSVQALREMIIKTPSLARADIVEIHDCVERFGNFNHRFIVLKLQSDDQRDERWLRLERRRRLFVPGALRQVLRPSLRSSEDIVSTVFFVLE